MAEKLVTMKTSERAHRAIRIIAAGRGLKQYEVMEVLIDLLEKADAQLVFELFAKKTGEWKESS